MQEANSTGRSALLPLHHFPVALPQSCLLECGCDRWGSRCHFELQGDFEDKSHIVEEQDDEMGLHNRGKTISSLLL